MYWLFKTEPNDYSYDDLTKDGQTTWNGVKNFQAINNLKKIVADDEVLIYHTGKEKAIVGVARVTTPAYKHNNGDTVVDIVPLYYLKRPVTLSEVKADPRFTQWELVRQARLSVMPVSGEYWQLVHEIASM